MVGATDINVKIIDQNFFELRLGYGMQLAASFISHEYHYVGMTYYGCGYGAYHNLIKFIWCIV